MAEKKNDQSAFTVTDRRLFTPEGELRKEVAEEPEKPRSSPPSPPAATGNPNDDLLNQEKSPAKEEMPAPPTHAEQQAQADAYKASAKELDSQVELSGHSARDLVMTFERFLASLYMTAMLQLGLMREQGSQPRIDMIGARQTIDTLSLISEKTKGNLTATEENFLQNSLYELRMAYVEVTNALARPPEAGPATGTSGR
jgi:hypothetical protein